MNSVYSPSAKVIGKSGVIVKKTLQIEKDDEKQKRLATGKQFMAKQTSKKQQQSKQMKVKELRDKKKLRSTLLNIEEQRWNEITTAKANVDSIKAAQLKPEWVGVLDHVDSSPEVREPTARERRIAEKTNSIVNPNNSNESSNSIERKQPARATLSTTNSSANRENSSKSPQRRPAHPNPVNKSVDSTASDKLLSDILNFDDEISSEIRSTKTNNNNSSNNAPTAPTAPTAIEKKVQEVESLVNKMLTITSKLEATNLVAKQTDDAAATRREFKEKIALQTAMNVLDSSQSSSNDSNYEDATYENSDQSDDEFYDSRTKSTPEAKSHSYNYERSTESQNPYSVKDEPMEETHQAASMARAMYTMQSGHAPPPSSSLNQNFSASNAPRSLKKLLSKVGSDMREFEDDYLFHEQGGDESKNLKVGDHLPAHLQLQQRDEGLVSSPERIQINSNSRNSETDRRYDEPTRFKVSTTPAAPSFVENELETDR